VGEDGHDARLLELFLIRADVVEAKFDPHVSASAILRTFEMAR